MNKLNERLTLIANLSVVAGIVFLVVEIRQNTQSMEVSAYQDLMSQISELNTLALADPEFGYFLLSGGPGSRASDMSDSERQKLEIFFWLVLRHGDMAYYQYERGLLTEERLQSATTPLRNALAQPYARGEWDDRRGRFAPTYRSWVDSIVAAQR